MKPTTKLRNWRLYQGTWHYKGQGLNVVGTATYVVIAMGLFDAVNSGVNGLQKHVGEGDTLSCGSGQINRGAAFTLTLRGLAFMASGGRHPEQVPRRTFATHGLPQKIVSDNRPSFTSLPPA